MTCVKARPCAAEDVRALAPAGPRMGVGAPVSRLRRSLVPAMSLPGSAPLRRALLGLAGALAIAASAAPIAQADFTLPACGGVGVAGRGSTFQGAAFNGFRTIFGNADPVGCSATSTVRFVGYNVSGATGSGAGLAAMGAQRSGNTNGNRDDTVRFAGTDIPP